MDQINQIALTAENVEKIVDEFYATSQLTNEFKPQLDQWLKQAQNSQEAWVFSWQLIDMSKSVNCQFYGASCLYNKVSKFLHDVPTDQYDVLKNKLLEKLLLYASTIINQKQQQIRLIQRKLNSALAKLALYLIQDQWQNCVLDIIQTIPNCMNNVANKDPQNEQEQKNQLILIVVDLFTLLPEEYSTMNTINKLRRTQINAQLKKNFHLISEYLVNLFNCFNNSISASSNNFSSIGNGSCFSIIESSIKCLTSWIEFGMQFGEIQPFIDYLFIYIYNDSLFEQSAESLTCLFQIEDNQKHFMEKNFISLRSFCNNSVPEVNINFRNPRNFEEFILRMNSQKLFFQETQEHNHENLEIPMKFSDINIHFRYTNTLFKYTPRVLSLKELLNKYVQNKDTDGCVVLTKLILSFGENQLNILFDGLLYGDDTTKTILIEFIQLIMSLSSMPGNFPVDEESSDLTFVFWYTLQDTLLGYESRSSDLQVIFRPFFLNLMEIFIVKLQLPESYDDWTDEEKERLRCYRIDIGDTMVYMISIIGEVMIEFIIKRLVNAIETSNTNWKVQESLIYMLQSVVSELNESCSPDFCYSNDPYLITFIELLPKIKYINKHILSTTLLAVGSLGSWLERNVHILPNAINLCLLGLKTDAVTQSASFAIKDIINDCNLASYADQIITNCQDCLKTGNLAQNYEARLMSIIGMCLSDLLTIDHQRTLTWLQVILEPYLIKLSELAQLKQADKQAISVTCHLLNLVSQLMSSLVQRQQNNLTQTSSDLIVTSQNDSFQQDFKQLNNSFPSAKSNQAATPALTEKEIVNSILVKLMPIYKQFVLRNSPSDTIIIDKLFESISMVLASNITSTSPNSENINTEIILNSLIEMFYCLNEESWRRFAYEVCRQIFIIWWKTDKYKPLVENLFLFSNQNAMKLMSKDMAYFHNHTDVVEQYCTCLAKLLKSKYYDLFEKLNQESIIYLMKFVQLGMQLPEQYTLRAVATFIEEFIKYSKIKNHLIDFMEHNSVSLIQIALIDISGGLPRHLVDILAGILHTFIKEYPQLTNTILNQILIKSDFQPLSLNPHQQQQPQQQTASNVSLTKEQKAAFIKSMLSEANNKRKFKEIVTEFSLTCRGLINSQYAKETTNKY